MDIKKILFSLLFVFLISTQVYAATYYVSPTGGGAASCVDDTTNACTFQRAITVAGTGTNTILCKGGTYTVTTEIYFDNGNTGGNITIQPESGQTCTLSVPSTNNRIFHIKNTMVSGSITFDNLIFSGTYASSTSNLITNLAPEVNLTVTNSTLTNTASGIIGSSPDTANNISLITGNDGGDGLRTGATTNVKIAQKILVGGSNIVVNRASFYGQRRCGNIGTSCDMFVSGQSWDYRNLETLTATIETDSAGAPSGTPVTNGTSQTIYAFEVPYNGYRWIYFKFANNVTLTAGTNYWLVLQGSYTASSSNYIYLTSKSSSGTYAGSATYNGTSWSANPANYNYLFTIDRAHTRNLTITGNTMTGYSGISFQWGDTLIFKNNTQTTTDPSYGSLISLVGNGTSTTCDEQTKKVIVENNTFSSIGPNSELIAVGIIGYQRTYTDLIVLKNNTGNIMNIFTNASSFVKKVLIQDNNFNLGFNGNVPLNLGLEVNGTDPEENNTHPFDQIIIQNNTLTFTSNSHNHIFRPGIGAEHGIFRNNKVYATYGSGVSSGGWGLIIKADNWYIIGNQFYGPGPAIYLTSNYNYVINNTLETYNSTGSNATILFRTHQDAVYGGTHGVPMFNYVVDNIIISNGAFRAVDHCDQLNCNSGSVTNPNRSERMWSNYLDYNIYYARDNFASSIVTLNTASNISSNPLSGGISGLRTSWQSATYTDPTSISQYNDLHSSLLYLPTNISGVGNIFRTTDQNVVGKGSLSGTDIGSYQTKYTGFIYQ